jgi:iron complex transport system ATP-binding protein
VLLLDEPTAALDPRHQHVVLDTIRAVARDGHAVIIVLHDLASVIACAVRAVLLCGGRITADAHPLEVIGSRESRDAYGVDLRVVATARTHAVVALPFDRPSTPSVLERSPP